MIDFKINEDTVRGMLEDEIKRQAVKVAKDKYFMTMKELSEHVNLSTPVIHDRLILNGLPHFRKGQKYLFRTKDVEKFLDQMLDSLTNTNDIDFFNGLNRDKDKENTLEPGQEQG